MKKMTADFVVIGGGGAGLAAAITAHQSGVESIIILEKSHYSGGNSRMAGGHVFAVETREQIESGKVISKDSVFKETMAFHHYNRVEPRILRTFIENAPQTVDWLEDMGFKYYNDGITNYMADGQKPFGNFIKVTNYMAEQLRAAGHILLRDTRATGLERDGDGRLCGVFAEAGDGTALYIEAAAAVITTGGFTGNPALLRHYFPDQYDDNFYTDALPQDGDGIEIAERAGALLTDYCTLIKENAYSCDSKQNAPNRASHLPASLWVNARGERFHDESNTMNESTNALIRQPGKIGFALFDKNILDFAADFSPSDMPEGSEFADAGMQMEQEFLQSREWVCISDTLEGISAWMGVDHSGLTGTIREYNDDCDAGRDSLFAKIPEFLIPLRKPPFYALKFRPILIDTAGPIVINHRAEVLDKSHRPIPGLYAAGVITSGWQGVDYHLHGSALSYSLTTGLIAGREASAYIGA